MSALVKYDAACRALAEAVAIDEVKDMRDKAAAMQAYAKQAKNKQLEVDAGEIRIRAERRLGEMLIEQKQTVGMNTGAAGAAGPGRGNKNAVVAQDRVLQPTLSDVGISKDLSSRAQAIAKIPESEFEAELAQHREEQKAVTGRTMQRLANKEVANASKEKDKPDALENEKPEGAPDDYPDFSTEAGREKAMSESIAYQAEEIQTLRDRLTAYGELSDDAISAEELIFDLRKELITAYATIEAITQSRDRYMNDNAQLKRQVAMLQKHIKKAA